MRSMLGWTMLSRDEMRLVERSIANGEQDTRDEIGFLLIHQGFADRFFPGTSVLHTRIRYALFVPWIYEGLTESRRRGSTLQNTLGARMLSLAKRLKVLGEEPTGVIGGDVVHLDRLSSQPPDRVYWSALKKWGILLPQIDSSSDALRRISTRNRNSAKDDDNGQLDDFDSADVFAGLVGPPKAWDDEGSKLNFALEDGEKDYLRDKLLHVARPDGQPSLLSNLVGNRTSIFAETGYALPRELDLYADEADREALGVARDAAHLAAIGRMVYGALVESLRERDQISDERTFRNRLVDGFKWHGTQSTRCNLSVVERLVPNLSEVVRNVLRQTQIFAQSGNPKDFESLLTIYRDAEISRKSIRRARLAETSNAKDRRYEWVPARHTTPPLHFRWYIVERLLADLHG